MRRYFLLVLLLAVALVPLCAHAQPAPTAPPVIRYHFGDNPAWAAPPFDDSAWPVAKHGAWPLPPFHSSGFVWVRMQLPVRPAAHMPLALMLHPGRIDSQEVFFQGTLIGQSGQLPPHPVTVAHPYRRVYAVPSGLTPARVATIALRIWYSPSQRYGGGEDRIRGHLGPAPLLQSELRANHQADILAILPFLSLTAFLALLGAGLFVLWYWSRRRELFWFSLLLITHVLMVLQEGVFHVFLTRPWPASLDYGFVYDLPSALGMFATAVFLCVIFNIQARWIRIVLHLAWIVFIGSDLIARFGFSPTSTSFAVLGWMSASSSAEILYVVVMSYICIRHLIFGPNRAVAFAMALVPIGWVSSHLGIVITLFHTPLFFLGFFLAGVVISVMLIQQAIAASRQGDRLKGEIDAAREIQQRLVPLDLPMAPGCHIETIYLPAAEVGGDFYQCRILPDGTQRILVGDVSGKGAAAAMTGAVLIGASEGREADAPSRLLHHLNQALLKNQIVGFVTCLCAHISPNGTLTVANAGHLPPYRNGEEIELDSGLPLGITKAAQYSEKTVQLAPGDTLTFLSDGVIEARNASGELFGFERTREISRRSAEQIAQAAQAFGQEDDITVLTLQFTRSEAALA